MQVNVKALSKKAIDAALNGAWAEAVSINEEILGKSPNDKNAKIRLGRAYVKTKEFAKAKKIFKEVLEKDPINKIALKNLKLADEKKSDAKGSEDIAKKAKVLIQEPGTSTHVNIPASSAALNTVEPGQEVDVKATKTTLTVSAKGKEIGSIDDHIARVIQKAAQNDKEIKASIVKINDEYVKVLLECKSPIFESNKQTEKPYVKKGLIDEPKIIIPEMESPEE